MPASLESPYPRLLNLFNLELLPEELQWLEGLSNQYLDDFFYTEFRNANSLLGDAGFYEIKIGTFKRVALEFPGTSLALVVNPSTLGGQEITEIPLSFEYKLEIIKYLKGLKPSNFSGDPLAYFQLILSMIDLSLQEMIDTVIETFINDPNPIQKFITDFNANNNPTYPLSLNSGLDPDTFIDLIVQIQLNGLDFHEVIFKDYINIGSLNDILDNIKLLFRKWFGDIKLEDTLTKLLIPQFNVLLNRIVLGLEFPPKVLKPVDVNISKSVISFEAGKIVFNSNNGFQFHSLGNFNFTKSYIGNSGFTIDFNKMKLDLSRKKNIPEATADGRPLDFMGAYVEYAEIGLPQKWFKQDSGATLAVVARKMVLGTGGLTAEIGIEVIGGGTPPSGAKLEYEFASGFKLGFQHFRMVFQQNELIESSVKGCMTIPKFKQCGQTGPLEIDLEILFQSDGDFEMTADFPSQLSICFDNILKISLDSLSVGKDDNKAFLCISGQLSFEDNALLGSILKDPFAVEKMCIYSDGSFEIEGGSLPLPDSVEIPAGPAKISITSIHFGSHEEDGRIFRFFGFDGGVNVDPSSIQAKGLKYYFTIDDDPGSGKHHRSFLRLEGIAIDLVIPMGVDKSEAALLLKGWLDISGHVYKGSLSFELPKAKIAGGASMIYDTKYPAWIVDAFLELSTPLLLGTTGLGIFGFRGLFGLRFLATKQAVGLTEENTWFDYYVAPPVKGVDARKMSTPDETVSAANPFSIGAGVSLATANDNGNAFSSQLFLFISLPKVMFLEGRANVLGERVGPTSEPPPPFFAFLSFAPGESIELGMGADYKIQDDGKLLALYAEVQAAFFFKNPSAWYIHFGTDKKPIEALVFNFIHAYAYLMINGKGLQTGAGAHLGFEKKYGPVKASVAFYFDVWGKISFERPQIGAGANVGGHVDVSVFGLGFYLGFAAGLSVEAPEPYRIFGYVDLCVGFKLIFKKIEKCFTVKFEWEKSSHVDDTEIMPLPSGSLSPSQQKIPVNGIHIPTGKSYRINYFGSRNSKPNASEIDKIVPLDTYIDFQSEKNLDVSSVADILGGWLNGTDKNVDLVPPNAGGEIRQVKHTYKIHQVNLYIWDGAWKEYHPYEALATPSAMTNWPTNPSDLKIGFWQKSDLGYNKFRLLAQTPFNYMEPVGDFVPEQMGLTASTLYCVEKERSKHCVQFNGAKRFEGVQWHFFKNLLFRILDSDSKIVGINNPFNIPVSIQFDNNSIMELYLSEPSPCVDLKLSTYANGVKISYYRKSNPIQTGMENGNPTYTQSADCVLIEERIINRLDLLDPVNYDDETNLVVKVTIEPNHGNLTVIQECELQIEAYKRKWFEGYQQPGELTFEQIITQKEEVIAKEKAKGCITQDDLNADYILKQIAACQSELNQCREDEAKQKELVKRFCRRKDVAHEAVRVCVRKLKIEPLGANKFFCVEDLKKLENEDAETLPAFKSEIEKLDGELAGYSEGYRSRMKKVYDKSKNFLAETLKLCKKAKSDLAQIQAHCKSIEQKIERLNQILKYIEDNANIPTRFRCSTFVHEICWLTETNHAYNQTIPGIDAIEGDYELMQDAIDKTLSPIWRPCSKYLVEIELSDTVKFNGTREEKAKYYFGFETEGPLGHFSEGNIQPTITAPTDYKAEEPETSLKYYIDYLKSYPNANGELLYAKPLYFENPDLRVFFTKPYVWHFLNDWPAYHSLNPIQGELQILVKDPTQDIPIIDSTQSDPVLTQFPATVVNWINDPDPYTPEDVQILNNMVNMTGSGTHCWTVGGSPIQPPSLGIEVPVQHLLPLKLYTAVFNNIFKKDGNPPDVSEIHRYVFQTSRYPDFKTHIESYILTGKDGSTRDALFDVSTNLSTIQIGHALEIVKRLDSPTYHADLVTRYADFFERLIEGLIALKPLEPPVSTEFNLVKNTNGGVTETIGLWIRSLEAINSPKIPLDELNTTVRVFEDGILSNAYHLLFSKDCTQVFLMNHAKRITASILKVEFDYLLWNGNGYDVETVITGDLTIV